MSKHTELPWAHNIQESLAVRIESRDEHGISNDGWIIAECVGPDAIDNVEYIVLACNSHKDLLALLGDILEWDGILPHSKTRIKAAIEKAQP